MDNGFFRRAARPILGGMRADTQPHPTSRSNLPESLGALVLSAFLFLAIPDVARGQQAGADNPDDPGPEKIIGPNGEEITDEECSRLEGSTAPIQRLARLAGNMSVRNLEFTYFGKPVYALTEKEFALLRILKPFCDGYPSEIDKVIFDRLEKLVNEARDTRDRAIQWINEATTKLDKMEPSPEAIREVHNLWTEMENRRLEMLTSDQLYFAEYLNERRNELYAGKQAKPRILISPFDPGPSIPPDQKE